MSNDTFANKVAIPYIRICLLVFAALAIGFASWLETSNSSNNCSFKNNLSIYQVQLYQNISSNITTPDYVSFGLWKSCYTYTLNCTCSSTNLKYQPDISSILRTAGEHNATPPEATSTSLSRFAPLLIAIIFAGLATLVGFAANGKRQYRLKRVICGFIIISFALTTYVFGATYKSYDNLIKKTCKDRNNTIYCIKYKAGAETIVFGLAIAFLFIAFVFWWTAASFRQIFEEDDDEKELKEEEEEDEHRFWCCFIKPKPSADKQPKTGQTTTANKMTYEEQQETLAAWRDASYYSYQDPYGVNNNAYYDYPDDPQYYSQDHDYFNNPTPVVPQKKPRPQYTNNANYSFENYNNSSPRGRKPRVTSNYDDVYDQPAAPRRQSRKQQTRKSSQPDYFQQNPIKPNQHDRARSQDYFPQQSPVQPKQYNSYQQTPLQTPFQTAQPGQKRRSNRRSQESSLALGTNGIYKNQAQRYSNTSQLNDLDPYQQRYSNAASLNNMEQRQQRYSSNSMMDEMAQPQFNVYRTGNKTPTSMSPHPFSDGSHDNFKRVRNSIGPGYEEYASSGSNSSLHDISKKRYSQQQVPILNMPPIGVEHPLNKKVIRDKRIQNYLQQATPTSSSISS